MHRFRIYLIAILLLAFGVEANTQELPKAVLVDEFGAVSCEDLLSRQDYFLSELSKHPEDKGFAIVYADGRNPKGFVKFLTASLFMRQFDRNRMRIVLAQGKGDETNGRFWRMPTSAEIPSNDQIPENQFDLTKPFLYGQGFSENVCPSFSPDLFAELILNNPGSRARLVIAGPTSFWRQSTADEELETFERYTKLPKSRIEFYFVHGTPPYTSTEYWYLPPKKR